MARLSVGSTTILFLIGLQISGTARQKIFMGDVIGLPLSQMATQIIWLTVEMERRIDKNIIVRGNEPDTLTIK